MKNHSFIFEPSKWKGQGSLFLSEPNITVHYESLWHIKPMKDELITATQMTDFVETGEQWVSEFIFSNFSESEFKLELDNNHYGKGFGKGTLTESAITWDLYDTAKQVVGKAYFKSNEDGSYRVYSNYLWKNEEQLIVEGDLKKVD